MNPLATARQLWRLNQEGLLVLVEAASPSPISATDADVAIKAVVAVRTKHSHS